MNKSEKFDPSMRELSELVKVLSHHSRMAILRYLSDAKASNSLVIMGSQGHGFFNEIFISSVSHNVSRSGDE